jgi:hypothetical protein
MGPPGRGGRGGGGGRGRGGGGGGRGRGGGGRSFREEGPPDEIVGELRTEGTNLLGTNFQASGSCS